LDIGNENKTERHSGIKSFNKQWQLDIP